MKQESSSPGQPLESEATGFDQTARLILDHARQVWNMAHGYILLLDEGNTPQIWMNHEGQGWQATAHRTILPLAGIWEQALHEKAVWLANGLASDAHILSPANILVLPILLDEEVQGILALLDKPGGFDDRDVGMAQTLCGLLANALRDRQTIRQLQASETRYRRIFDQSGDGILVAHPLTRRLFMANATMSRMLGYSRDELLTLRTNDIHPPQHMALVNQEFQRAVQDKDVEVREMPMLRKDGTVFYADIKTSLINLDHQTYLTGVFRDITERKIEKENAQLRQERFEALLQISRSHAKEMTDLAELVLEKMAGLTGSTSGFLVFLDETETATRIHAWPRENAKHDPPRLPAISRERLWEETVHGRRVQMHNDLAVDASSLFPHGQRRPHLRRLINLPVFDGNRIMAVATVANKPKPYSEEDVQQVSMLCSEMRHLIKQRQSEAALQASERKFRALFNNMPNGVAIYQPSPNGEEFIFTNLNKAGEAICNATFVQVIGQPVTDIFPGVNRFGLLDVFRQVHQSRRPEHHPVHYYQDDHRGIWLENYVFPLESGEIVAIFSDITQRIQAEIALKASEERFRMAILESPFPMLLHAEDGQILAISKVLTELTGYGLGEIPTLADWVAKIFRDLKPENPFQDLYGLTTRQEEGIKPVHTRDGRTLFWEFFSSPLGRLIDGRRAAISVARDITLQKEAEHRESQLQNQLRHAAKMEAVGTLAGGIAHDFNNILAIIVGNAELTAIHATDLQEAMNNILEAANRGKALIMQLLTFSRQQKVHKKPLQPLPLIKEALKFLRSALPKTIELREYLPYDHGMILADPSQLHQVIMNLCTNAGQAIGERNGIIEVSLKRVDISHGEAELLNIGRGSYFELTVQDSGPGIPSEIQPRIFEPFFTTRENNQGTGLGLAVVHGAVQECGGTIRLESPTDHGTIFRILFPMVEETVHPHADGERPNRLELGRGRILLVDDEKSLVTLGKRMLEILGYQCVATTLPREALMLMQEDPHGFDGMITDQIMPEMTGVELAQAILALRPDLPIFLCTGFSETVHQENAEHIGFRGFFLKPLSLSDLSIALKKAIKLPAG